MNNRIITSVCVLCAILLAVQRGHAQGNLTPPGTPAATMKSLDQIEPRTAITSAPYTISSPGSYYLTTNITVSTNSAITITANSVTLDLNGFTISSTAPSYSGTGIFLAGQGGGGNAAITILNGHIMGGFVHGIYFDINNTFPKNIRVAGVSVSGCQGQGIDVNTQATVIEFCTVWNVGGDGIVAASVSHSAAHQCGGAGVHANTASDCYGLSTLGNGLSAYTAINCYGICNGSSTGLNATYIATGCYGQSIDGTGLYAFNASNCYGTSTTGTGVYANDIAIGCYGFSSSGIGLRAFIANSSDGSSFNVTHKYNMP